jgi:protein-L-isoaspartate(D-aspartate) O-methyltransferase
MKRPVSLCATAIGELGWEITLRRVDTETVAAARPAELRMAMVDRLKAQNAVRSMVVEDAMRSVPRHIFVPDAPLEEAYGLDPVVTHRDSEGIAVSSASAPGMVGRMLEQLGIRPGHRVLEIGAGTGYNAALLAHLAGPSGGVTTVEYDEAVTASAQEGLNRVGHGEVTVVCGDGVFGWAANAPYDRIIVTAGAWDVPSAWWDQLADGGVLLVPLRMRGLTRAVALERDGMVLRSRSVEMCGFIPMRGAGAVAEQNVWVGGKDGDLLLRIDDGRSVDTDAIGRALDYPEVVTWTGVPFAMPEILDFWLAGVSGLCRVLASSEAVKAGRLRAPWFSWGSMGVFDGGTVAYLTVRGEQPELGVCAYGPDGGGLADMVVERIRQWDREGGPGMAVRIEVQPVDAVRPSDGWLVIDKKHSRVVIRMVPGV